MKDTDPKVFVGCATAVASAPAVVIWYILFGAMLHRTHAETWEWALYVGYLVCSVIAYCLASLVRIAD